MNAAEITDTVRHLMDAGWSVERVYWFLGDVTWNDLQTVVDAIKAKG